MLTVIRHKAINMKSAITVFFSAFFCLQAFAQQVTISGYITDKKNGETLTGATIFVKDKKRIFNCLQ